MADHAAVGVLCTSCSRALTSRPDELVAMTRFRQARRVEHGEQIDLGVLALRPAFLHEVRALGTRAAGLREKREAARGSAPGCDGAAVLCQRRPGIVDEAAREGFAIGRGIVGRDLEDRARESTPAQLAPMVPAPMTDTRFGYELLRLLTPSGSRRPP